MMPIVVVMFFAAFVVVAGIVGPLFVDAWFDHQHNKRMEEFRKAAAASPNGIVKSVWH